jgi:hypothetical protein
MDSDRWMELEFNALRSEIIALGEAERSTVRFYIPVAAVVYAVPYFLLQQPSVKLDHQQQAFIWTFCATVVGLLTLAMIQSIFWSVDGARRIGTYIRNGIEPRTGGGLRWETVLTQLNQKRYLWPSDSLTIAVSTVLANLAAAFAAGMMFLAGNERLGPAVAASAFALMALPSLRRIAASTQTRRAYAKRVNELMAAYGDGTPKLSVTGPPPSTPIVAVPAPFVPAERTLIVESSDKPLESTPQPGRGETG